MNNKVLYGSLIVTGGAVFAMASTSMWSAPQEMPEKDSTAVTQRTASAPGERDAASRAPDTAPAPASDCAFEVGQTLGFEITSKERAMIAPEVMKASGKLLQGQSYEVSQSLHTRLVMRAVEVEPQARHTIFLGQFSDMEASQIVEDARLERPFLIEVSRGCEITAFAYHRDTTLPYARVQQGLLYDLSWRLASAQQDAVATYKGRNSTGAYDATSIMSEDTIVREITSYEPWQDSAQGKLGIKKSVLEVVGAGGGHWLTSASLEESLVAEGLELERAVLMTRTLIGGSALADVSAVQSEYVWADLLPMTLPIRQHTPYTARELHVLKSLQDKPLDEAIQEYVARVESEVGIQDTWPALKSYLEARPDKTGELVDKLKRQELPAEATLGVYIALGNARTDESRQALEQIMTDEHAPIFERTRAILNIVHRPDVGDDVSLYLDQEAAKLASGENKAERILARHALLALGVMSGMRPDDDAMKLRARARVSALLQELTHPLHLRPVYGAIANVGDASWLELVRTLPSHPDKRVRKYGAIVIRRMPMAESEAFTRSWLEQEQSEIVKRELYRVLELQSYDRGEVPSRAILALALEELESQPSGPITRKALIQIIGRANLEFGESMPELEEALLGQLQYEIDARSGLYSLIAEHVDATRLREFMLDERIDPERIAEHANPPEEIDHDPGQFIPGASPRGGVQ